VPAAGSSRPVFQPLITSTAQPDGSVVHVVQEGQTLWTIAAIYGVDLDQLLSLNGLTQSSFVHPGDKLIVRAGATATATITTTPTATSTPEPASAVPTDGAPAAGAAGGTRAPFPSRDLQIGLCVAAWIVVVVAGVVIASRRV
jgi:Tfp pilus assembly protein FimV